MKKKILIGSLLVLTLLLLMPSIPAIQQKTIEDKAYSDFVEKLKDVDLEDIEVLDGIRHPILYLWVRLRRDFRFEICVILFDIAAQPDGKLLFWCAFLLLIIMLWARLNFWDNVSEIRGWGWDVFDF